MNDKATFMHVYTLPKKTPDLTGSHRREPIEYFDHLRSPALVYLPFLSNNQKNCLFDSFNSLSAGYNSKLKDSRSVLLC